MNSKSTSISKIEQFWDWFSKNCNAFGEHFENEELLKQLDDRVRRLGDFSWEIGPGKVKDNLLVISPNGDPDLLHETKRIVNNAVPCNGWEYYFAKQPKEWDLAFIYDTEEGKQEIDASGWEYILLRYDDEMFAVIIKGSYHLSALSATDQLMAAEIVLEGILGEEFRIHNICEIEIVEAFDPSQQDKASIITNLADHLKRLGGSGI